MGYEYKDVTVKRSMEPVYTDGYTNFGWALEGTSIPIQSVGSVFAYTANLLPLCVILAIPGFVGWIIPYLFYCNIRKKKTEKVAPLIDQKYDEIYEVREKANVLPHHPGQPYSPNFFGTAGLRK